MTDAATIKRAAKMIRQGINDHIIAAEFSLHVETIRRWRRWMGIKITKADAIRSDLPNFSDSELAKQYGVTRQWVWELRKRSKAQ